MGKEKGKEGAICNQITNGEKVKNKRKELLKDESQSNEF